MSSQPTDPTPAERLDRLERALERADRAARALFPGWGDTSPRETDPGAQS